MSTSNSALKSFKIFLFLVSFLFGSHSYAQQWQWLNPKPEGFDNQKIVFISDKTGFIMNSNGDLLRTDDKGISWRKTGSFPNCITLSFSDSTGVISGYAGAIYVSSDNGDTWTNMYSGIRDALSGISIVSRDTFFVGNTINLYASSNGPIYKTTDRGKTWTTIYSNLSLRSLFFIDSKTGYAGGTQSTIVKTTDGGQTWQQVHTLNQTPADVLSIQFLNKDTGYAIQQYNTLLRTYDGGQTWQNSNTSNNISTMYFINGTDGYLGGEYGSLYATHDAGASFTNISFVIGQVSGNDVKSICFLSKDTGFIVGLYGHIMETTNGGSQWQPYSFTYTTISDIDFPTSQTAFAAAASTVYKTNNNGANWSSLSVPFGTISRFVHFYSSNNGIVSTGGTFIATTDGGSNWSSVNPAGTSGYDAITDLQFITPLHGFTSMISNSAGAISETTDGGFTWNIIWKANYAGEFFQRIFYINHDTAYATRSNALYKTTDGSKTWNQIYTSASFNDLQALSFTDSKHGYLGDGASYIYKTDDGGKTWTNTQLPTYISEGIRDIKFYNASTGYAVQGSYYSVANAGYIYKTTDSGKTWQQDYNTGGTRISFTSDASVVIVGNGGTILTSKISGNILPVVLASFTGYATVSGPTVKWQTASETNTASFDVERSTDGVHFIKAGSIKARGAGSSGSAYNFTDVGFSRTSALMYYRLHIIDLDGKEYFSDIIQIQITGTSSTFVCIPNPATTQTNLYFTHPLEKAVLTIYNERGSRMLTRQIKMETNVYTVPTSNLATGIYHIIVQSGKEKYTSKLIVVAK